MARLEDVGVTLSGGGVRGVGAMLGFASALDLFLVSHDITDLGFYSGVSAGAIVSSFLAAGFSPHDMIRSQVTGAETPYRPVKWSDIYRPNLRELARTPARLARAAARAVRGLVRRANGGGGGVGDGDGANGGLGVLPSSLLASERMGEIIRENLERASANDFRRLGGRLSVGFYDLLRSERVACGGGPDEVAEIPVHEAVLASAALPGIFAPRRLRTNGRTVLGVDGGTGGVTVDLKNASPLAALFAYNDAEYQEREDLEHASAIAVLGLSLRLLFNQRNIDEIAAFVDAHPRIHVFLHRAPAAGGGGMMSLAAANRMAPLAFDATKAKLEADLDYLAFVLEPRGVTINRDIAAARYDDVVAKGRGVKTEIRERHGL